MKVPLWVIDTNVLVSAALTPGGVCDQLLQHAVGGLFVPAWDNALLVEYRDVLSRRKFALSAGAVRNLLAALPQVGFHQGIVTGVKLPDPDDLPFLAVALATPDRTVVTGNSKHFPTATMITEGVTIYSAREALDYLERTG